MAVANSLNDNSDFIQEWLRVSIIKPDVNDRDTFSQMFAKKKSKLKHAEPTPIPSEIYYSDENVESESSDEEDAKNFRIPGGRGQMLNEMRKSQQKGVGRNSDMMHIQNQLRTTFKESAFSNERIEEHFNNKKERDQFSDEGARRSPFNTSRRSSPISSDTSTSCADRDSEDGMQSKPLFSPLLAENGMQSKPPFSPFLAEEGMQSKPPFSPFSAKDFPPL